MNTREVCFGPLGDTLRAQYGVGVDDQTIATQMQSGSFLVLFDGLSEVPDRQNAIREVLRTTRHADYRSCRFVIAMRPVEAQPPDLPTFQLRPLERDFTAMLLPQLDLGETREKRIRIQLSSFGQKPIEPLLFAMAIEQSAGERISYTKAQLYEGYFRRLLRLEGAQSEVQWWGGGQSWEISAGGRCSIPVCAELDYVIRT
jgi:hypothetical protein